MGITYQYEPLQVKPKWRQRKNSQFKASFGNTLDLLEKELAHLRATNVALQVDCERSDLRLDGMLRAGTKLTSPAIALSFESKHGPLTYPCDTFSDWQANLRAIALTLEHLRTIDRYGVTAKGEQYTGWAALPPPNGDHWTREQAAKWLSEFIANPTNSAEARAAVLRSILTDQRLAELALREAEKKAHPDHGGNNSDFHKTQQARKLLLG